MCEKPQRVPLREGTYIGKYRVERCIGGGGSSLCYQVFFGTPERMGILKESYLQVLAEQGAIVRNPVTQALESPFDLTKYAEQLVQESNIIATLRDARGENSLYFLQTEQVTHQGVQYLVIDTAGGELLQSLLSQRTETGTVADLPALSHVLERMLRILEGVEPIHRAGYLHGDIAPDNLFVSTLKQNNTPCRRTIFCIDFNSALPMADKHHHVFSQKPGYSPVEFRDRYLRSDIDYGSDLYSVGAIFFEILYNTLYDVTKHKKALSSGTLMESPYLQGQTQEVKQAVADCLRQSLVQRWKHQGEESAVAQFQTALTQILHLVEVPQRLVSTFSVGSLFTVGRQDACQEIYQTLQAGRVVTVVQSIGGLGKSHLANYYAQQHGQSYDTILFISCEKGLFQAMIDDAAVPITNFSPATAELETTRDGNAQKSQAEIDAAYYSKKLEKLMSLCNDRVLLIFDGLNDQFDKQFGDICKLPCHKLLTSRADFSVYPQVQAIPLQPVSSLADLEQLFYHHCPMAKWQSPDVVRKILKLVSYHTLTVILIAKSAQAGDLDLRALLENLEQVVIHYPESKIFHYQDGKKLIQYEDDKPVPSSVDKILSIVFDFSNLGETAHTVLRNLALFPDTGIDRSLFKKWVGLPNLDTVNRLIATGWIGETVATNTIALHQVIGDVCLKKLCPNGETCKPLLTVLAGDVDDMDACLLYENIPHIRDHYLSVALRIQGDSLEINALKTKAVKGMVAVNTIVESWLATNTALYGAESAQVAYIYYTLGRLGDHEKTLRKALSIYETLQPPEDYLAQQATVYAVLAQSEHMRSYIEPNQEAIAHYRHACTLLKQLPFSPTPAIAQAHEAVAYAGRNLPVKWVGQTRISYAIELWSLFHPAPCGTMGRLLYYLADVYATQKKSANEQSVMTPEDLEKLRLYKASLDMCLKTTHCNKSLICQILSHLSQFYSERLYTTGFHTTFILESIHYCELEYYANVGWHNCTDFFSEQQCIMHYRSIYTNFWQFGKKTANSMEETVIAQEHYPEIQHFPNFDQDAYQKARDSLTHWKKFFYYKQRENLPLALAEYRKTFTFQKNDRFLVTECILLTGHTMRSTAIRYLEYQLKEHNNNYLALSRHIMTTLSKSNNVISFYEYLYDSHVKDLLDRSYRENTALLDAFFNYLYQLDELKDAAVLTPFLWVKSQDNPHKL